MALTGQQYLISAGDYEATVVEVGAGLRRLTYAGRKVAAGYGEDELPPRCAGAVLMPWPNRLAGGRYTFDGVSYQVPVTELPNNNANHGLARWARWNFVEHTARSVTLSCAIVPQSGWPFEITATVIYSLDPQAGLTVTAAAHNTGRTRAPFAAGFHPYLALNDSSLDDIVLAIPAQSRIVTDARQIPTGTVAVQDSEFDFRSGRPLGVQRLDDAFTSLDFSDGVARVELRAGDRGATMWMDETFGFLQVFTATELAHHAPAVAVEPMTAPADAFNSGDGLIVLESGGNWRGQWGITALV